MRSGNAAIGTLVLAACSVPGIDLTGKACPCPDSYSCDLDTQTCVHASASDAAIDTLGSDAIRIDAPAPCKPGFVKSTTMVVTAGNLTFTNGNTNGDVIVVGLVNGATVADPAHTLADTEANTYTRASGISEQDDNNNAYYEAWWAPVTGGAHASNAITVTPAASIAFAVEYSCVALAAPFDTLAGVSREAAPYSITCADPDELIVTVSAFEGGGTNWTVSGTDRSGLTNKTFEWNDTVGVAGPNTIDVETDQTNKPGSVSFAFEKR